MKYSVSIDVPQLDEGLRFYRDALGLTEIARPIATYAILKCGEAEIGIMESRREPNRRRGLLTFVDMSATGLPFTSTSTSTTLKQFGQGNERWREMRAEIRSRRTPTHRVL